MLRTFGSPASCCRLRKPSYDELCMTKHSWFLKSNPSAEVKARLFCFPYAGGSAMVYRDWSRMLPTSIEVISVELPGRGGRLREPPFSDLPTLIDALVPPISSLLDLPFGFFGHSMGAIIAFETARRLRNDCKVEPKRLFVSGRQAAHIPDDDPHTYDLPRAEFIAELGRLNGTPREVLDDAELMELMIPTLRADFRLVQTYEYSPDRPLGCPITAFGGLQDVEVGRERLLAWRELTTSEFSIHLLSGDHFFLRTARAQLLQLLARKLYEL